MVHLNRPERPTQILHKDQRPPDFFGPRALESTLIFSNLLASASQCVSKGHKSLCVSQQAATVVCQILDMAALIIDMPPPDVLNKNHLQQAASFKHVGPKMVSWDIGIVELSCSIYCIVEVFQI